MAPPVVAPPPVALPALTPVEPQVATTTPAAPPVELPLVTPIAIPMDSSDAIVSPGPAAPVDSTMAVPATCRDWFFLLQPVCWVIVYVTGLLRAIGIV